MAAGSASASAATEAPSAAVLLAGAPPDPVEIDLATTRSVVAADGEAIDVPVQALHMWGYVKELELDDDSEAVELLMVSSKARLAELCEFSVKYAQQGIAWKACLLKTVPWMEIPTVPEWCKLRLKDMDVASLFDLLEDASAVRFIECENACLMRVAWLIKDMDEATLHGTFATDKPWTGSMLGEAVAPGSRGEQFSAFVQEPVPE